MLEIYALKWFSKSYQIYQYNFKQLQKWRNIFDFQKGHNATIFGPLLLQLQHLSAIFLKPSDANP